uniref:Uncharacterized protein n=1 Tax=Tetranychus urticae TaxID=32264 RepID=T1L2D7_TETUR
MLKPLKTFSLFSTISSPPDFERIVCVNYFLCSKMSKLLSFIILCFYFQCTLGFHLEKTKGKHVISASTAEGIKKKSEVAGLVSGTSLGVAKAALKKPIFIEKTIVSFKKVTPEKPKYKVIWVEQKVPIMTQEPATPMELYKKETKVHVKKTNMLKLSVKPYFKGYFKGKTFGKILG